MSVILFTGGLPSTVSFMLTFLYIISASDLHYMCCLRRVLDFVKLITVLGHFLSCLFMIFNLSNFCSDGY